MREGSCLFLRLFGCSRSCVGWAAQRDSAARLNLASVKPCHCLLQLSVGEQLYRGQAFHETFKCRLAVRLCDILKNPVDYRDPGRRRTCSYSYAGKVLGAEVVYYAAHTLLTAVAALCADAQLADREGDIVVNDDDVFGRYLIELPRPSCS